MPEDDSRMRALWDELAEEQPFYFVDNRLSYDDPDLDWFWAEGRADLDKLLSLLGAELEPGARIVEIGCGVGRLTRPLADGAEEVWAVDISERMLELARELNPGLENVHWIAGDGTSLAGIESGVADACVSNVVFQHIPDPEITLGYVREIGRVLRPGGWTAFQFSNDPSSHQPRRGLTAVSNRLKARRGRGPSHQAHPAWLGSAVDVDDLRQAAAEGGLTVERVIGEGTLFCGVLARRG